MSKRVSNKATAGGARSMRTWRIHRGRVNARANRARVNAEVDAQIRAVAKKRMEEQARVKPRPSIVARAFAAVRRFFH